MPTLPATLTTTFTLSNAQIVVEVLATLAFALSGLVTGARKRLDAVGMVVVAGLAAFGGGTLRDVLLDRRPFFWVQHANWLWVLLALTLGAMMFARGHHLALTQRALQWPDTLGLGLFTAAGTQIALDAQMPALVAVLMGVITAVFGGVLRDIVCNEIPTAFRDHQPYAVCAFVGAWALVGAHALGWGHEAALLTGTGVAVALRALAVWTGVTLPAWQVHDAD